MVRQSLWSLSNDLAQAAPLSLKVFYISAQASTPQEIFNYTSALLMAMCVDTAWVWVVRFE